MVIACCSSARLIFRTREESLSALGSMRIFSDLVFSNPQNPTMQGWDDNDESVGMRSRVQGWHQVLHQHQLSEGINDR